MPRAVCSSDCLRGAQVQDGRVLRAGMAKKDFAEEERLKLNSENSRNEAQNHGENCNTQSEL